MLSALSSVDADDFGLRTMICSNNDCMPAVDYQLLTPIKLLLLYDHCIETIVASSVPGLQLLLMLHPKSEAFASFDPCMMCLNMSIYTRLGQKH